MLSWQERTCSTWWVVSWPSHKRQFARIPIRLWINSAYWSQTLGMGLWPQSHSQEAWGDTTWAYGQDPSDGISCTHWRWIRYSNWIWKQWCFTRAINDNEIEPRCRLLAAPLTSTTNELLTIAQSFYAVEHGAQHMSVGGSKFVYAVHTSNQKQHQKKTFSNNQCGNCIKHHATGCTNCPVWESECNKCGHIGHWKAKCKGGAPPHKQNGKNKHLKKGKKHHRNKGHTDITEM